MSRKRIHHLVACAVTATLATALAFALDSHRSALHQTQAGLQWARQVSLQAEGLILEAREKGEKDPVSRAVITLSEGEEPRLVRVSRVTIQEEGYALDPSTGQFEYTHALAPGGNAGIRIQLQLGYSGFLGAGSVFAGDALAGALFALCFAAAFFATGRYFGFDDTARIRKLVGQWVGGAKTQLAQLGIHIREMVRSSQKLASASHRSRAAVSELRDKIHAGLGELHESRKSHQDGQAIAARAETLALDVAIEANRLGAGGRRITEMATELHRRIQAMHEINRKGQAALQAIERKIEPWATDADQAYHAFDEIQASTESLSRHIRGTTLALMGHARQVQDLNRELGTGPPSAAPSRPADRYVEAPPRPAPILSLPKPLPAVPEKSEEPLLKRLFGKRAA